MLTIEKEEGYPLALLPTFLAMTEGSIGSNQYRELYVHGPEGNIDVIGDGDLGCAYYVSSILCLCELSANGVHTTIDETVEDMRRSGWVPESGEPRPGDIVVWAAKPCTDGRMHRHIGIVVEGGAAVSMDSRSKTPKKHGVRNIYLENGEERPVEAIYRYPAFTR